MSQHPPFLSIVGVMALDADSNVLQNCRRAPASSWGTTHAPHVAGADDTGSNVFATDAALLRRNEYAMDFFVFPASSFD